MISAPQGTPVRARLAGSPGRIAGRRTGAARAAYAQRVRSFVLSVTGRDRPGIVSSVTRVLLAHRLNLEDAEMAILRGHFAVMLVLTRRPRSTRPRSAPTSSACARRSPLETVSLTEVPALDAQPRRPSHSISVYGADHPGIVHGVAEVLAGGGVNVVGLSTRVLGEDEASRST